MNWWQNTFIYQRRLSGFSSLDVINTVDYLPNRQCPFLFLKTLNLFKDPLLAEASLCLPNINFYSQKFNLIMRNKNTLLKNCIFQPLLKKKKNNTLKYI